MAFGDGRNDIDLFEIADEAYAVVKWLLNNFA
ncbi:MAG: HAD hydrolase family protein [Oliverpabstia sp.]